MGTRELGSHHQRLARVATELEARLRIVAEFPGLQQTPFEITSPRTPQYNCIAWAVGDDARFWWPHLFWPPNVKRQRTRKAFVAAFKTKGFVPCDGPDFEFGFEKIVLYEKDGLPTHAARLLEDGRWASKLGSSHDITHALNGLNGENYGTPAIFLRRQI